MRRSIHVRASRRCKQASEAFTRIELLSVCAAVGVLALLVVPALATNKSDSERMVCFNNLRLVGRGVQTWAGDHNQQFPWRTLQADGGLLPSFGQSFRPGNAWAEYFFLSNELVTPKILTCPSDSGTVRARDWNEFRSVPLRANAISYSLSMDCSTDFPGTWLSADRNFRSSGPGGGCSAQVNNTFFISTLGGGSSLVVWTNGAVHGEVGHVLTTDGSVEFTSNPRLQEILTRPKIDDNGSTHFLRAR